jgi:hypothetical protein
VEGNSGDYRYGCGERNFYFAGIFACPFDKKINL